MKWEDQNMFNKLSNENKRLLGAVVAVCFLFIATETPDLCSDCELLNIDVTFVDNFNKQDTFAIFFNLPNAVVIVINTKKKGISTQKITMKKGEQKEISLEGGNVYAYTIFELEWDLQAMGNLSVLQVGQLIASGGFEQYTEATRVIDTGVILDDSTITFQ